LGVNTIEFFEFTFAKGDFEVVVGFIEFVDSKFEILLLIEPLLIVGNWILPPEHIGCLVTEVFDI
jgi:hypothetical protein